MSLITVDPRDRKQLYEQIIDSVKNLILTGELKPDDKLPSVRSLAKDLGINPNTIQKAYGELERCGIIMTLQGRGSIVIADRRLIRYDRADKLIEKLTVLAYEMQTAGMTEDEFAEYARQAWQRIGGSTDDIN